MLEQVERGELDRVMVFMPPRMGKSTTVSRYFPAWFLGRNPDAEVILASYGASLANEHSRACRNVFRDYAPAVFGEELSEESSAVDEWKVDGRYGAFHAAGVDGPMTGKGGRIIIIDDPIKGAAEAESETIRESAKRWYQQDASTRLAPGGAVIIVQTRWHEDDLAGWLLEEEKKGGDRWTVVSFPMLSGDEEDEHREALWPERYPEAECRRIKVRVGTRAWVSMYQQRPSPAGGTIFQRTWWRRWRALPPTLKRVAISVDCSFKEKSKEGKETTDRVSVQSWGTLGANRYLLRRKTDRMGFRATIQTIKDERNALLAAGFDVYAVLVEDKANGPAVIEVLKEEIPGIIAVEPEGGKVVRAHAAEPQVEAGQVWLPDEAPWVGDFIDECASFPNGKHDDDVDAMTQALNRMRSSDADGWVPTAGEDGSANGADAGSGGWVSNDVEM